MHIVARVLVTAAMLACAPAVAEETVSVRTGDDTFVMGATVNESLDGPGDAFVAGRTVSAGGTATGDLHVSGFDVTVSADTSEDLYAAGAMVVVRSNVAEDLFAAGMSVRTEASAETGGNARLYGRSVTIGGPVAGALSTAGQDVVLNAPVKGDVRILAQSITFGPNAVIDGTLTYSTREEITVPDRVAPAARVVFEPISASRTWEEWDTMRHEMPGLPTFASVLLGFVVSLLFFVVLGALMLGFMPRRLAKMRKTIAAAPGQTLLLGVIGLSMLFGMVPITALTIIGLPFVPIVVLAIVVAWTLGYALGAYAIAMRVWNGFGGDAEPSNVTRLLIFAAAITVVALLNFIPFVGWVANYTLVLLGFGAMTHAVFQYLIGNPGEAFDIDMKPIEDD